MLGNGVQGIPVSKSFGDSPRRPMDRMVDVTALGYWLWLPRRKGSVFFTMPIQVSVFHLSFVSLPKWYHYYNFILSNAWRPPSFRGIMLSTNHERCWGVPYLHIKSAANFRRDDLLLHYSDKNGFLGLYWISRGMCISRAGWNFELLLQITPGWMAIPTLERRPVLLVSCHERWVHEHEKGLFLLIKGYFRILYINDSIVVMTLDE